MWYFERVCKCSDAPSTGHVIDPQNNLWVTSANTLSLYDFWREHSDYEGGMYSGYYPQWYQNTNKNAFDSPVGSLTINPVDSWEFDDGVLIGLPVFASVNNKLYLHEVQSWGGNYIGYGITTKIHVFNTVTMQMEPTITIPEDLQNNLHCIPYYAFGKIWYTTKAIEDDIDDEQILITYNPVTDTWSSGTTLGMIKQFHPHRFAFCYSDDIVIDGWNNDSVYLYNGVTEVFNKKITVMRRPMSLFARSDRKLLVGVKDGVIAEVDLDTEAVTLDHPSVVDAVGVVDDGTYLWSIGGNIVRTLKGTYVDNVRYYAESGGNYTLSLAAFGTADFRQLELTPQFSYQYWNGSAFETRTVLQYLFTRNATNSFAIRNSPLHRPWYIYVRATGMIGTGEQRYHGETQ